jgi:hypothetical protein
MEEGHEYKAAWSLRYGTCMSYNKRTKKMSAEMEVQREAAAGTPD